MLEASMYDGTGEERRDNRLTLDGWVVLVDEMTLDELNGEARFTDATSTDNHQFILPQELPFPPGSVRCARKGWAEGPYCSNRAVLTTLQSQPGERRKGECTYLRRHLERESDT